LFCVSRKWKKAITKEHGFSVVPWRNEKKISDTNTRIYIESKVVPKVVFLCRSEITLLMKVIPETCCAHSIRYLLFLSYPLKLLGHICYFILMQPNTWLPWLILVTALLLQFWASIPIMGVDNKTLKTLLEFENRAY
jgi:hypothetical protein